MRSLMARGYLPKELPFLFSTGQLATVIHAAYRTLGAKKGLLTKPLTIPIAAKGGMRRTASIPNPISQAKLVKIVVDEWQTIKAFCDESPISFSRLCSPGRERALRYERRGDPEHSYESMMLTKEFSQKRLELSASSSHILKADISNFYGSIYTHGISWALHGKKVAKDKRRDPSLIGNRLDQAVRDCNDGQTKGIPIGPDTSRILSEIIGTAIDKRLVRTLAKRVSQGHEGIRWVDDFLLYFQTPGGRDKALGTLVESLEAYELSLNHRKTQMLLPGEDMIEASWVQTLRRYHFKNRGIGQFYDLLGFVDAVAALAAKNPGDSVALYASKILWTLRVDEANLADFLAILWKLVHLDPRVVAVACIYTANLSRLLRDDKRLRKTSEEALTFHLAEFMERRWALETCWLLWLCLKISAPVHNQLVAKLSQFDHPLVALAAIEVSKRGLIKDRLDIQEWKNSVNGPDALTGPRWMLAYELRRSGTLRTGMEIPFFEFLKKEGVSFLKLS
jgi:hypothetical protein